MTEKTNGAKGKNLKQAILQAAELAGDEIGEQGLVSYLQKQAMTAPSPFLTLLGKALNEDEEPITTPIYKIEIVPAPLPQNETAPEE